MDKINFQNGITALNEVNLNQMQDNIEEAIDNSIETITNENGTAIKYPDGTMICRKRIMGNSFSCTATKGNYFYDTNSETENIKQWTFPQPFISTDDLTISGLVASKAYSMTSLGSITTEAVTVYCVLPYSVSSITFDWNLTAIGRWK